jgi:hypothetical protein
VEYLQANKGAAEYLVVASNAMSAAPIILNTDEPMISLGGYNGIDPVFTAGDLSNLVDRGAVRFFLIPDRERMEEMRAERESGQQGAPQAPPPGGPPGMDNESASWVQDNCEKVPQEKWQSSGSEQQPGGGPPMMRAQALYDCGT